METADYQRILEQLLERLDRGTKPWRRPWGQVRLWIDQEGKGLVPLTAHGEKGGGWTSLFGKGYIPELWLPREPCERILSGMPRAPPVLYDGVRGYYDCAADLIQMPPAHRFHCPAEYYSALFHEMTHATGHPSRLDRIMASVEEDTASHYAREEMTAEIGAAFLAGEGGILKRTIDNSASYLNYWHERLGRNMEALTEAGAEAIKASEYILAGEEGSAGNAD